jgi:hypothetical protein
MTMMMRKSYHPNRLFIFPLSVKMCCGIGSSSSCDGYEVLAFENDDVVLTNEMGAPVDMFILSVHCVSVEKEKINKACGAMRKVVSPCAKYATSSGTTPFDIHTEEENGGEY